MLSVYSLSTGCVHLGTTGSGKIKWSLCLADFVKELESHPSDLILGVFKKSLLPQHQHFISGKFCLSWRLPSERPCKENTADCFQSWKHYELNTFESGFCQSTVRQVTNYINQGTEQKIMEYLVVFP